VPELILHHYPESLFSEKARAMLNARQLPWRSVIIPMIMPRPDTIPLTGGYRRTPVLQVGAEVYCDTALIAAYLDDKGVGPTFFPAATRVAANVLARWVDTELFWASVTLRFQPSNAGSFFANSDSARAFAADRANFSQGATTRQIPLHEALPRYQAFLADLDAQLADRRRYLFGADWTIADFSAYHVVWFIHGGGAMADMLASHGAVAAWFERMRAFGKPIGAEMTGAEALDVAQTATPVAVEAANDLADIALGEIVDVGPTDYGVMPSRGALVKCDTREIVIRRSDARTGDVHVHFPRQGFGVRKATT
jgi:glutathione S-transferase